MRTWHFGSVLSLALLCLVTAPTSATPPKNAPEAYDQISRAALARLPIEVRAVYDRDLEVLLAYARGTGAGAFERKGPLGRLDFEYAYLDLAAESMTPADRLRACLAFPHQMDDAIKLYAKQGQRLGGTLPWALQAQFDALVAALEQNAGPDIGRHAGRLVHLAVDASLPFSTTRQPLGPESGRWTVPEDLTERFGDCKTVRRRVQTGLLYRQADVLADSLSRPMAPCRPPRAVIEDTFAILQRSSASLDLLLEHDRSLRTMWQISGGEDFEAIADVYIAELDRRCLPVWRRQLDEGACFAAGLLLTAAQKARVVSTDTIRIAGGPTGGAGRGTGTDGNGRGAPTTGAGRGHGTTERGAGTTGAGRSATPTSGGARAGTSPGRSAETKTLFVGSKNSKKFHAPTCRFAKSIKPTNRVTFPSAAEATAAGREPCAICKPHD